MFLSVARVFLGLFLGFPRFSANILASITIIISGSEVLPDLKGKHKGNFREISGKTPGKIRECSGTLPGTFHDISGKFPKFPGKFREMSGKNPGNFR